MHELAIRGASDDDIDRIMELEALGFPPAIRENRAVMLARLRHFPEGFLLLENTGGQAIGYLCSEIWASNKAPAHGRAAQAHFALGHDIRQTHRPGGDSLYISSMTIDPRHRGHGLGRLFFEQALGLLRTRLPQLRSSLLLLSTEWHGAHRIYQLCGYTEIARLDGFFSAIAAQDADAIVMQLSFNKGVFAPIR